MAHDRGTLKHCGWTTLARGIQFLPTSLMSKLFLFPLAVAFTLVTASASAAEIETIVLFNPATPETPESIQVDRHGNLYVSLSRTGEVRKISPTGTQSTLAILCPASTTRTAGIALDHQNNVYVVVNPCGTTGERGGLRLRFEPRTHCGPAHQRGWIGRLRPSSRRSRSRRFCLRQKGNPLRYDQLGSTGCARHFGRRNRDPAGLC